MAAVGQSQATQWGVLGQRLLRSIRGLPVGKSVLSLGPHCGHAKARLSGWAGYQQVPTPGATACLLAWWLYLYGCHKPELSEGSGEDFPKVVMMLSWDLKDALGQQKMGEGGMAKDSRQVAQHAGGTVSRQGVQGEWWEGKELKGR